MTVRLRRFGQNRRVKNWRVMQGGVLKTVGIARQRRSGSNDIFYRAFDLALPSVTGTVSSMTARGGSLYVIRNNDMYSRTPATNGTWGISGEFFNSASDAADIDIGDSYALVCDFPSTLQRRTLAGGILAHLNLPSNFRVDGCAISGGDRWWVFGVTSSSVTEYRSYRASEVTTGSSVTWTAQSNPPFRVTGSYASGSKIWTCGLDGSVATRSLTSGTWTNHGQRFGSSPGTILAFTVVGDVMVAVPSGSNVMLIAPVV